MKNIEVPKIGFRNIKTGIAVFLCLVIFNYLNNGNYVLACIAAILCMEDTIEHSIKTSKNRLLGILIGGFASILFLYAVQLVTSIHIQTPAVIAIGISFIIYICNLFKLTKSCSVACIMYISIMFGYSGSGAFSYVINEALYTLIGVLVAIAVNTLIKPPKSRPKKDIREN